MTGILDSEELREVLNNHKDWPVVFLVDSDIVGDGDGFWYAGGYSCFEGEVMDCESDEINTGRIYTDRVDFLEDVEDYVYKNAEEELSDEELDAEVNRICNKYEAHWKKALLVYITM